MVLSALLLLPFLLLQLFSGDIMLALGVERGIADDVGAYTKIMTINSLLLLLEIHVSGVFVNLNYAWCATMNGVVSGLGVDCVCSYYFIFVYDWGVAGVAYTQIVVKLTRLGVWAILACWYGLTPAFLGTPGSSEPIFADLLVYRHLTASSLASNFSGWFIYELQLVALANVEGITKPALAAGAIWVQLESTVAAVQSGWIDATSMRTLNLLGKVDQGASKSFALLCVLSAVTVAVTNVPILLWQEEISSALTNDEEVCFWLRKIVWVLVLHSQSRISCLNAVVLFIPIGKAMFGVLLTFVAFYFVASPLVALFSLSNLVFLQSQITVKMTCIVAATSAAQVLIAVVGFTYLVRLDWLDLAELIRGRANTDHEKLKKGTADNTAPTRHANDTKANDTEAGTEADRDLEQPLNG